MKAYFEFNLLSLVHTDYLLPNNTFFFIILLDECVYKQFLSNVIKIIISWLTIIKIGEIIPF